MDPKAIILVGGPDSGKSNYLARLWLALQSKKYTLLAKTTPDDIQYIEGISNYVLSGKFAPRTEPEDNKRDFSAIIHEKDNDQDQANLIVPDMYGEIWKKAVSTLEIPQKWLNELRKSNGAILFLRVQSKLNVSPLNWVTSQDLIKAGLGNQDHDKEIPTQVNLIELLRFLEENMKFGISKPKVAILVTAWDLLHKEEAKKGPQEYIRKEYPLLHGKLQDMKNIEIEVFGCSIVGGDFKSPEFREKYLEGTVDDSGYIVKFNQEHGTIIKNDITLPIQWLLNK